jgi:hypothetical protein
MLAMLNNGRLQQQFRKYDYGFALLESCHCHAGDKSAVCMKRTLLIDRAKGWNRDDSGQCAIGNKRAYPRRDIGCVLVSILNAGILPWYCVSRKIPFSCKAKRPQRAQSGR